MSERASERARERERERDRLDRDVIYLHEVAKVWNKCHCRIVKHELSVLKEGSRRWGPSRETGERGVEREREREREAKEREREREREFITSITHQREPRIKPIHKTQNINNTLRAAQTPDVKKSQGVGEG